MEFGISGIYLIRHIASGKLYVGSAVDVRKRFSQHQRKLRRGVHHSAKLQRAWDKYGESAFQFEVIEVVSDRSALIAREQWWIDHHDAANSGYNHAPTAHSLLGYKFKQESKERMSKAHAGKSKSPEHVAKVRAALLGRTMTPEQCEKMRAAKLGKKRRPHSDETKAKMSAARVGMKFTATHRQNLSLAKLGKQLSEETKAKRAAARQAKGANPSPP